MRLADGRQAVDINYRQKVWNGLKLTLETVTPNVNDNLLRIEADL